MGKPQTLDPEQKKLVEENLALAQFLARLSWQKNPTEIDLEEIVSVAYQGLCSAALRWSPEGRVINPEDLASGKAFSGFARQRIIGSILDWQRGSDHVQRSYRSAYKLLKANGYGTGASEEELALVTGLTITKIRQVIHAVESVPVSLDSSSSVDNPSNYVYDEPASVHNVEASALVQHLSHVSSTALDDLPVLQQVVITLRYYVQMDLQNIAVELGVGLPTVREAHSEAILFIHSAMKHRAVDHH